MSKSLVIQRRPGNTLYFVVAGAFLLLVFMLAWLFFATRDTRTFAEHYSSYMAYINKKAAPDAERMSKELGSLYKPVDEVASLYHVYGNDYAELRSKLGNEHPLISHNRSKLEECKSKLPEAKDNIKILEDEKVLSQYSILMEAHGDKLKAMYVGMEAAAQRESRTKDLPPKPQIDKGYVKRHVEKLKKELVEAEAGLKKLGI